MKIILFDFDGVIADTYSICYKIISSHESIAHHEYKARFEGNVNDATRKLSQNTKRLDFFAQYTPELMKCEPNHELTKVIKELARDYTLVIISSTISEPISKYLEVYGLKDSFAEILGNDIEKSKVKKINSVIQRYKILPTETVFITDTLGDIKEAEECSVQSIAVTWGYHSVATLQKGNPRYIIDRPAEIIETIKKIENLSQLLKSKKN